MEDLGRGQQTIDRLEAGMGKTWPNAPLSVGTSKTWHCARMSTGISTMLKPDLGVLGHPCQCAGTMSASWPMADTACTQRDVCFRVENRTWRRQAVMSECDPDRTRAHCRRA